MISLADSLPDPRVAASADRMTLCFASPDARKLAVSLLDYYRAECLAHDAVGQDSATVLRWNDPGLFATAVDELDDCRFSIRFPATERQAWIATLPTGPYQATLFRGEREIRNEGYASDPGDLGTGRYLTSCPTTAANYGVVTKHQVSYARAIQAHSRDIIGTIDLFYRTVRGNNRLAGADLMRADFLMAGLEALIVSGYDSPGDHVTVVEFTSLPPRPLAHHQYEDADDITVSAAFLYDKAGQPVPCGDPGSELEPAPAETAQLPGISP